MPDIAQEKPIQANTHDGFYPWQSSLWQQLYVSNQETGHFPHALLLSGISGIGKKDFAFYLAKGLLCQTPKSLSQTRQLQGDRQVVQKGAQTVPCNQCRSCQLLNVASHPDLYHIGIPEDKKIIPVDAIRELIQWSVLNAQLGTKKIIIIEPAEAMNINAANSLLKTLEEPVANTFMILLSHKKQALLATIRSRCQCVDIPLPEEASAQLWLQEQGIKQAELMLSLSSGAPLLAKVLAQGQQLAVRNHIINRLLDIINSAIDPVLVAEEFYKATILKPAKTKAARAKQSLMMTAYDIIYWFDSLLADIARLAYHCTNKGITNLDRYDDLQDLSNRLYLRKLLQLSDSINKAYNEIQGSISIQLLFEQLLIEWKNCKI